MNLSELSLDEKAFLAEMWEPGLFVVHNRRNPTHKHLISMGLIEVAVVGTAKVLEMTPTGLEVAKKCHEGGAGVENG